MRIMDLVQAQRPPKEIAEIINCSERLVYKVKKVFKDMGSVERKKRMTGYHVKATKVLRAKLKEAINKDPSVSMRKLAKQFKVSDFLIRKVVKEMGLKSYVCRHYHLLSAATRKLRMAKGKKLDSRIKKAL